MAVTCHLPSWYKRDSKREQSPNEVRFSSLLEMLTIVGKDKIESVIIDLSKPHGTMEQVIIHLESGSILRIVTPFYFRFYGEITMTTDDVANEELTEDTENSTDPIETLESDTDDETEGIESESSEDEDDEDDNEDEDEDNVEDSESEDEDDDEE